MKVRSWIGPLGPEPGLDYVQLTPAETATLARAATILERLRETRTDDDDDLGTDIALAGYVLRDISDGHGRVEL